MDDKQKEELTILEDKANGFCTCFGFLEKEKDEYSCKEVISALKVILRNYVREIVTTQHPYRKLLVNKA